MIRHVLFLLALLAQAIAEIRAEKKRTGRKQLRDAIRRDPVAAGRRMFGRVPVDPTVSDDAGKTGAPDSGQLGPQPDRRNDAQP